MLESNKATDFESLIEFDERNQPMVELPCILDTP